MPLRRLTALLLCLGLGPPAAGARELLAELQLLHLDGLLAPAELDALLADPRLRIEAHYQPTRLVDGETARRERVMPLGSRLFAIPRSHTLQGAALERQGRTLRWRVPEPPPGQPWYRIDALRLSVPLPAGPGRPQPALEIGLAGEPVPERGVDMFGLSDHGGFELGWRLRLQWSDGPAPVMDTQQVACPPAAVRRADGSPVFRPRHPVAGLVPRLSTLGATTWRSHPLRQPLVPALAGWRLDEALMRSATVAGWRLEQVSLRAERAGAGSCRQQLQVNLLLANDRPVHLQRYRYSSECDDSPGTGGDMAAWWLADGSLQRIASSARPGARPWDAFESMEPRCGPNPPPTPAEAEGLAREALGWRDAFERH